MSKLRGVCRLFSLQFCLFPQEKELYQISNDREWIATKTDENTAKKMRIMNSLEEHTEKKIPNERKANTIIMIQRFMFAAKKESLLIGSSSNRSL